MKKGWVKKAVVFVILLASCFTIGNSFKDWTAEKDTDTETTTEAVQVVDNVA